ncbi:glutathione S-transferase family protein [Kaustia mangrovi]|uniref:Glutathione S-transferase family protein n=1 Tax=Kaustia mangrovi TaxID=2593653 RepID=A0A7S8HBG9_9HYPH|nr:glutathione S-transferase family protein [Kaustia mangrovi]QPC42585.1 glutathione S-transferase family protein [Kaustia mangrovi]
MPKLYHFPLDPFSRRIRLALGEYGADAELVEERPWEQREGFLALNPAGALPVMVDDDRTVIAGIEALSEYLEETRGARNRVTLLGETPAERAETRRLVAWFDIRFHREVGRLVLGEKVEKRFAKPGQGGGAPHMKAVRVGLNNIRHHLDYIGFLSEARNWLAGDRLTHADLAAAAHLSCIDYLGDVPWSENAAAKQWYQRIKSRPCFRPLLADHIRGMPPPRFYADLDF